MDDTVDLVEVVWRLSKPHDTRACQCATGRAARKLFLGNIDLFHTCIVVVFQGRVCCTERRAQRMRAVFRAVITDGALHVVDSSMHLENGVLKHRRLPRAVRCGGRFGWKRLDEHIQGGNRETINVLRDKMEALGVWCNLFQVRRHRHLCDNVMRRIGFGLQCSARQVR